VGPRRWEEPVVDAREEHGGVRAGVGDLVAVAVRDPFDQSVHAQAAVGVSWSSAASDRKWRRTMTARTSAPGVAVLDG
jgi:hypothetical protein